MGSEVAKRIPRASGDANILGSSLISRVCDALALGDGVCRSGAQEKWAPTLPHLRRGVNGPYSQTSEILLDDDEASSLRTNGKKSRG